MTVTLMMLFLCVTVIQFILIHASHHENQYQSWIEEVPMPYKASDLSANAFYNVDYSDTNGLNERIYLHGGCDADQHMFMCPSITNKTMYFTPKEPSFVVVQSSPTPRYRHMAVTIDEYLYVFGGRDVNDTIISSVDRYDTLKDKWSTMKWTLSNATSDGSAFTDGTYIYIAGGYSQNYDILADVVRVNVLTGRQTSMSPMLYARGDTAAVTIDGRHYVMGGWNATDNFCTSYKIVESYDIDTDTWRNEPNMLYGRGDLAAGAIGNHIFSIAGETKADCNATYPGYSVPVQTVGRYDLDSNSWSVEEELSLSVFRFAGVSYNDSEVNAIYLFGGQGVIDLDTMTYPVLDTCIKYLPQSVSKDKEELTPAGIFGIVIGVAVAVAGILFLGYGYYVYARRGYYTKVCKDQ